MSDEMIDPMPYLEQQAEELQAAMERGEREAVVDREPVGYVVVCWNQASGQPEVIYSFVGVGELANAELIAETERARTAKRGRRERYAVAEVIPIEDPS